MVKYSYRFNKKRMYLDRPVYEKIKDLGINWEEIEKEKRRLQILGSPVINYNTAAIFAIDKRNKEAVEKGVSMIKESKTIRGLHGSTKGFVGDNITLTISLMIIIAMTVLLAAYMSTQNDNIQNSNLDSTFKSTFNSGLSGMSGAMDKGLVIGIVLLVCFLLYSAYNIGTNFGLFLFALIINMAALFILPIAEDFLITTFYNNDYATATASMPATFYIINNYTIFMTAVVVLLMIALYVRPSSGGQA